MRFWEHAEVLVITMALRVKPLSRFWRRVSNVFSISTGRAHSKFARKCRTRSIFILPPSKDELDRRLRGRGQDSEEVIAKRMGNKLLQK